MIFVLKSSAFFVAKRSLRISLSIRSSNVTHTTSERCRYDPRARGGGGGGGFTPSPHCESLVTPPPPTFKVAPRALDPKETCNTSPLICWRRKAFQIFLVFVSYSVFTWNTTESKSKNGEIRALASVLVIAIIERVNPQA